MYTIIIYISFYMKRKRFTTEVSLTGCIFDNK